MKKQAIILIAAFVFLVLAIILTNSYLSQQRQAIMQDAKKKLQEIQANSVSVLVAKTDIARGASITSDNLEVAIVPNQFIQPQAVTSLDRIDGMLTIAPISRGEQITMSKLVYPRQESGGLSGNTPVGKRAITVSVDNVAALAGMIKPGDYVDVIATVPLPVQGADGKVNAQTAVIPLFQNVLILAVGQEIGAVVKTGGDTSRYQAAAAQGQEKKEFSPLITIALSPQEANLIAFVQEQGKIRLVVRSPADSQIQPFEPVGWDALLQYVMPQQPKVEVKEEPQDFVEIYRGLSKEKVVLPKR
jgi:pilus assembly protein CpaB